MNNIKISELKETLNIDNESVFPLVFRNETRKVSFETIRDLLTSLNTDYTEKSGNIVTIITNIDSYCNIGVKSTELQSGTPVTVTISGKNLIDETKLTMNEENTIASSAKFRIIGGQNYTFATHSASMELNNIQWGINYFDADENLISEEIDGWYDLEDFVTVPSNAVFGQLSIRYFLDYQLTEFSLDDLYNLQFELGILASDYEEYKAPTNVGTSVGGSIVDLKIFEGTSVIYSNDVQNVILKVGYYTDTEIGSQIAQLITAVTELDEEKADKSEIPDVSQFITKSVNDLVNYYLKSETYSKDEVNNLIASVSSLKMQIVQTLPTTDIDASTIYLKLSSSSGQQNIYTEYVYINNNWEIIGTTDIDLSDYVTQTMLQTALTNFQEVFVQSIQPSNDGWKIWIDESDTSNEQIYEIVADMLDYYRKAEIDEKERAILAQIPNGEAEGESINLTDSAGNLSLEEVVLEGQTEQTQYEGRNLLRNFSESQTKNGITFTKNIDGSVTVSGTATANALYSVIEENATYEKPVLSAGTYTLSGCPTGGADNTYKLDCMIGSYRVDTGTAKTFTLTEDLTIVYSRIFIYSGVTINATFYPMVEKSSTATDYEPYVRSDKLHLIQNIHKIYIELQEIVRVILAIRISLIQVV